MKHEIEIGGLPEGWEPVAFRRALIGEMYFQAGRVNECTFGADFYRLIVKKKQPRRIVLEETDEVRKALKGDYIERIGEPGIGYWGHKEESNETYKIWREVKETDLSLPKEQSNEHLSLSVDDLRDILECKNVMGLSWMKVRDFLKDK